MSSVVTSSPQHFSSYEEYEKTHKEALQFPEAYWLKRALTHYWYKQPSQEKILNYNFDIGKGPIFIKWFEDGLTNICYNCLDLRIMNGQSDKVAFYWEGNALNDSSCITYGELFSRTNRFAKALQQHGVVKGDTVGLYMPMVPDLVVAILACARIGAVHSVVFAGFSAVSLAERLLDAKCKIVITADGAWRGPKLLKLKSTVSEAIDLCADKGHTVSTCIVLRHASLPHFTSATSSTTCSFGTPSCPSSIYSFTSAASHLNGESTGQNGSASTNGGAGYRPAKDLQVTMHEGRDIWWDDFLAPIPLDATCPVEWVPAEHPLFILYTSGSTGKPKGVVHSTGGYMTYVAATFFHTFAYQPDDVYWCTADVGWITGHSYVVYGPMLNGATSVMFEGTPLWPDQGRYWAVVEKFKVTKFYTAPTAIRALMAYGDEVVKQHDLSSLKVLGSVGEPINSAAWHWYHRVVGQDRCPIVDTFWQTETGGHMITPLPNLTRLKAGSACRPFIGIDARVLSEAGEDVTLAQGHAAEGYLTFAKPWPGMMRTIVNNHARFESVYFSRFPGFYLAGDGARVDEEGYFWITGRIDDMLNVSGHLISTAEVEGAIMTHPQVNEAAAVSRIHPVKGECLHCFVTLVKSLPAESSSPVHQLKSQLMTLIRNNIGGFAVPDHIQIVPSLPKTRSGKVVRRILRKIANQDYDFGDTSTLVDPALLDQLVDVARSVGQSGC